MSLSKTANNPKPDFKSLISGEELSVAGKLKTARARVGVVIWKTPGVLSGNELGPWIDSSGISIRRRLFICEFNPHHGRSDREEKLDDNE
jgi:hypothetical protein